MALALRYPKRVYPRMPKAQPKIEQYPLYALYFDGVDDYVEIPYSNSIYLDGDFTVTIWVSVEGGGAWCGVVDQGMLYTLLYNFAMLTNRNADGVIWEIVFTDGTSLTYYFPSAGRGVFAFYAIGVEGDKMFSSMNGSPKVYQSFSGKTRKVYPSPINLGRRVVYKGAYANIRIAHLCIYKGKALSLAEIRHNMYNPLNPVRDGLVLWLPMIEGYGTTVKDYSGYGNNGTIYGATWKELALYEIPAAAGL